MRDMTRPGTSCHGTAGCSQARHGRLQSGTAREAWPQIDSHDVRTDEARLADRPFLYGRAKRMPRVCPNRKRLGAARDEEIAAVVSQAGRAALSLMVEIELGLRGRLPPLLPYGWRGLKAWLPLPQEWPRRRMELTAVIDKILCTD